VASKFLNFALYQTGWFCCVFGAAKGHPWWGATAATVLVLVHVALVKQRRREVGLLLAAALIGGAVDSLQSCLGSLRFESGYVIGCIAPPWIPVMWMQFATLFRFGLAFLSGRYLLGAALGALGGPFAFWVGARLGAVEFGAPTWRSLLLLAVVWAVVFPILLRLAGVHRDPASPVGYRGIS
jgi:hypothetical protein